MTIGNEIKKSVDIMLTNGYSFYGYLKVVNNFRYVVYNEKSGELSNVKIYNNPDSATREYLNRIRAN